METYDSSLFIHTCYLYTWDQKIPFDGGSTNFTIGEIVIGAVSQAVGLVKTVSGTTTGYLVLSGVIGVFQDNETIIDSHTPPGTALVNGTADENDEGYGNKTQTRGTNLTQCRFINQKPPQGKIQDNWSGRFPALMLPIETTLSEGLEIYTDETAFLGTYLIQWPPVYWDNGLGDVDHITVGLQKVT